MVPPIQTNRSGNSSKKIEPNAVTQIKRVKSMGPTTWVSASFSAWAMDICAPPPRMPSPTSRAECSTENTNRARAPKRRSTSSTETCRPSASADARPR